MKESPGNLKKQVAELFKQSLKVLFPTEDNLQPVVVRSIHWCGDYECNATPLFRKIKKIRPEFRSALMLAKAIKLFFPESEIIQRCFLKDEDKCVVVVDVSRKWIAKNIGNMLVDGIQSWAPRLPITRAVLHRTKPTHGDIMHGGRIRSTIISDSLTKILEFSGVDVLQRGHVDDSNKQGEELDCPITMDQICETSSVSKNTYKRCKVYNPDIARVSDGLRNKACDQYLAFLGHYLREEVADWIIFVADDDLRDDIRDVFHFGFAKVLGWHSGENDAYPKVTHAGYRIFVPDGELFHLRDTLADLFDNMKSQARKALKKQGKDKKWSAQKLDKAAEGAVRYRFLDGDQLCSYASYFDGDSDDGGDSGVFIFHQYDSVCSIIRTLGNNEDIKQLVNKDIKHFIKKGGVLNLDLHDNDERSLGVLLLRFSEIVEEACTSLRPDIICKYLFHLAVMARDVYNRDVYKRRARKRKEQVEWFESEIESERRTGENPKLRKLKPHLVFEATRVVMHNSTSAWNFLALPWSTIMALSNH